MKAQHKLVLFSLLLASLTITACDDDDNIDTVTECGSVKTDCTTLDGWKDGICTDAQCVATECNTGYHLYQKTCEPNNIDNCGTHDNNCATTVTGWKSGTCNEGQCVVSECVTGKHIYNNICEDDSIQNCGTHDNDCATTVTGWKSGTCNEGQCVVSECITGKHLNNSACEDDSLQSCGSLDNDCTTVTGWKSGSCTNGQCVVSECIADMHINNTACEDDSIQSCGSLDNDCATTVTGWKSGSCTNAQCVVSECVAGKYVNNNACEDLPANIKFGHYEQDNDTTNGKEDISWRVLDIQDGKYLVISEKSLDVQPYDTHTCNNWEKSTIRSWLNGYNASYNTNDTDFTSDNFIGTAFTAEEKSKIIASKIPAHANPDSNTDPGNETTDMIFLLSIEEAQKYFTDNYDRTSQFTEYARFHGAASDAVTPMVSLWWLRTPGSSQDKATYISNHGSIDTEGVTVDRHGYTVRPAMWLIP